MCEEQDALFRYRPGSAVVPQFDALKHLADRYGQMMATMAERIEWLENRIEVLENRILDLEMTK